MDNFPINEPNLPLNIPLIGRQDIVRKLKKNYANNNPRHLSLVGPRFFGKSVLLNAVAAEMEKDKSSKFKIVVFWDLGHQTPASNEDFLNTMCKEISLKLLAVDQDCFEILQKRENPYSDLRAVFGHLADQNINITMLWDGCDKPLSSGKLTKNLWDQLRELARSSSLTIITASRKPLHELLIDEDSATSDFWSIFDPNWIGVGVFDEDDQNAVLEKLNNIKFDTGSIKELANWTGGIPPLYLLVVNQLLDMSLKQVSNIDIEEAAQTVLAKSAIPYLEKLWDHCSGKTREAFYNLIYNNEIPVSNIPKQVIKDLTDIGLGKKSGKKIFKNCRLMELHIKDQMEDIDSVARLFKENDNYQKHMKSVLIHRFNQVKNIDAHFNSLVKKVYDCIGDAHNKDPEDCLANLRNVLKTALDLILEREFPDKKVPEDWTNTWQRERPKANIPKSWPNKDVLKLTLLECMVGAYLGQVTPAKAKHVDKAAYYCLDQIKSYGNYGNHTSDEKISIEIVFVAVMTCIELVASLDRYG
jgi:hypothetical protein